MSYLKFHRMALGMTQAQVAKKAGVRQSTYCDYERGRKHPRPRVHKLLAEALQRPAHEFTAKLYGVESTAMVEGRA
jgi:transcriptional regulator with XRE-family HTH domain